MRDRVDEGAQLRLPLFDDSKLLDPDRLEALAEEVRAFVIRLWVSGQRPSAWELLERAETAIGLQARFVIREILAGCAGDANADPSLRAYAESLVVEDPETGTSELDEALVGGAPPRQEMQSGIDSLLRNSRVYQESAEFAEMLTFMARFREYSPYNNMLVRLQNRSCSFYATERDWWNRFRRRLKQDARAMVILAPMHPVLLVYDLDQTEGDQLPVELMEFARFTGRWSQDCLLRTLENARQRDRILVEFKHLSSTHAGFATTFRHHEYKMRIAIHEELNAPSRFGVLCHELAHIYLGHLGSDADYWWPCRVRLDHHAREIEAEAVAYLVTGRLGLQGTSHRYVCRHLTGESVPESVSLDLIAKVAGRIEEMSQRRLEPRRAPNKQRGEQ